VIPPKRNSHTFTLSKDGKHAYLFGGANEEGPLNDLYRLDLETLIFSQIVLKGLDVPLLEMHTVHVMNENQLLIIGGRGMLKSKGPEDVEFQGSILSVEL